MSRGLRTVTVLSILLLAATAAAQGDASLRGADGGPLADGGVGGLVAPRGAGSVEAELLPRELWPDLGIAASPDRGVMVGDPVTVTITVDAAAGDDVAVPRQDLAPFEVRSTAVAEEGRDRGKRYVFTLELLAFEPGEHTLGPVRLRLVTADGTIGRVETEPLPIEVGSLLGNEPNAELRADTAPVRVTEEDYTLAWIAGAFGVILLLAVAMLLLARWWAGRERPAAPAPPPRPAWEVAMERLAVLRRDLPERIAAGEVVRWADELSDTVREYLGHRYDFEGLESTTDEVVARVRKIRPPGITPDEVAALLGDCDLVKFAKATPDEAECAQLSEGALRIVQRTRPGAGPAAPAHAARPAQPTGGSA